MLDQVMGLLRPGCGEVVVDCTAGRGGHAEAMARAVGPGGTVVLLDADAGNLAFAKERLAALSSPPRVIAEHVNFRNMAAVLRRHRVRADVVLADLGFSSTQMDDPTRGFAFSSLGPLDMRLDTSQGPTAKALLMGMSERELADVIFEVGEDPFARRIARRVLERRDEGRLKTTADLAEAVVEAYGSRARASRMHPATRTFMALRIAVNGELDALDKLLSDLASTLAARCGEADGFLSRGARIAFLAFHSLEDRSIKRAFVDWDRHGWATRLARKPLVAEPEEQAHNPRSRSAKLRAIRVQAADTD